MRTHFLSKLAIPGRELALALEPDFDFYDVGRVSSLTIGFAAPAVADEEVSFRLVAECLCNQNRYQLTLVFEGVRHLVLPEITSSLFLPELEIEEVSDRMLEGIRFEVISHFEGAFRCMCREIRIVGFLPSKTDDA